MIVTLLIPQSVNIASIDNPRRAFLTANRYMAGKGNPPVFQLQLCSEKKKTFTDDGLFEVHGTLMPSEIKRTDLVVIPAFDGDPDIFIEKNRNLLPWILKMHRQGAEIASLCVGAYFLAATGLLDGKDCSTHWRIANQFSLKYPKVHLSPERVITDQKGIYTSGGAFSAANLILYLIEKYAGRETAIFCSKVFQIDLDRWSQSPFIIFEGQKEHSDEHVKKAQQFIESNYHEKINVVSLADMLCLSRRSLERRFKKATSNTLIEYIQRVKIEAAKKHFESSGMNINEVMYEVGYSDSKAFRNVFRSITGLTPFDYRNKYRLESVYS